MTWGTGCSKCGRAECGEWSGWRWSYDPIKPRWFGRYGDQTQIRGWRIGPIIFWRFNTVCTKNEQQSQEQHMPHKISDADALAQRLTATLETADLSKTPAAADISSDDSDLFGDIMAEADEAVAETDAFLNGKD